MENDELKNAPPFSLEAEQSVLGGALQRDSVCDNVLELINKDDFYRPQHRAIYQAMVNVSRSGVKVDLITVVDNLKDNAKLLEAGGTQYISSLLDSVVSLYNTSDHINIVKDKSVLREVISVCTQTVMDAKNNGFDSTSNFVDNVEKRILEIRNKKSGDRLHHASNVATDSMSSIEEMSLEGKAVTGVDTGYIGLNKILGGLHGSDLLILAGRPGLGKTTAALNIARYAALESGVPTAVFSLEMSSSQIVNKIAAAESMVSSEKMRTGQINTYAQWQFLNEAFERIKQAPLFIDDTPALTLMSLRSKCRRLKSNNGLGFVVVDYLQLMGNVGKKDSRNQEIAEISMGLKSLAKELNIPVLCLSQLNRGVESRVDKRPMISDLRESGSIEQDADIVILLYRDDYYNRSSEDYGVVEVNIAKNRHGGVGTVRLGFDSECSRFNNIYPVF